MLLVIGAVVATLMVVAFNVSAMAQGYGVSGTSGTSGSSTSGTAGTGAEVILFGVAGAGMIATGYFLTRKARS